MNAEDFKTKLYFENKILKAKNTRNLNVIAKELINNVDNENLYKELILRFCNKIEEIDIKKYLANQKLWNFVSHYCYNKTLGPTLLSYLYNEKYYLYNSKIKIPLRIIDVLKRYKQDITLYYDKSSKITFSEYFKVLYAQNYIINHDKKFRKKMISKEFYEDFTKKYNYYKNKIKESDEIINWFNSDDKEDYLLENKRRFIKLFNFIKDISLSGNFDHGIIHIHLGQIEKFSISIDYYTLYGNLYSYINSLHSTVYRITDTLNDKYIIIIKNYNKFVIDKDTAENSILFESIFKN